MTNKERTIELANTINDYFISVLEDVVNCLRKNNDPYNAIVKVLKKAAYNLKGYVEFSDDVDEEVKEPLKAFIDAICQITISKVEVVCKE